MLLGYFKIYLAYTILDGDVIKFAASSRSYYVRNANPGSATNEAIDMAKTKSNPDMKEVRQQVCVPLSWIVFNI